MSDPSNTNFFIQNIKTLYPSDSGATTVDEGKITPEARRNIVPPPGTYSSPVLILTVESREKEEDFLLVGCVLKPPI